MGFGIRFHIQVSTLPSNGQKVTPLAINVVARFSSVSTVLNWTEGVQYSRSHNNEKSRRLHRSTTTTSNFRIGLKLACIHGYQRRCEEDAARYTTINTPPKPTNQHESLVDRPGDGVKLRSVSDRGDAEMYNDFKSWRGDDRGRRFQGTLRWRVGDIDRSLWFFVIVSFCCQVVVVEVVFVLSPSHLMF